MDPVPRSRPPRRARWTLLIALVVLLLCGAAVVGILGRPSAGAEAGEGEPGAALTAEQRGRLKLVAATTREFVHPLLVAGEIAFDDERSSAVFAPQGGQVRAILARPGDHVEAGQPLAEIESDDVLEAESALVEAVGGKAKAAAARLRAEHEAARAERLLEAKAGSLKDQEEAEADLAEAVAEDQGADAELAAARRKLGLLGIGDADIDELARSRAADRRAVLRAPIAGVVVSRKIAPGQWLKDDAEEPLFAIADASSVWLRLALPETAAPSVRRGLEVEVTVPALPGRVFKAEVAWVGEALDPETRRLPARCAIANPDGALKAGMAADARIVQPARRAVAIPAAAVLHGGARPAAWVAARDGFARRELDLGAEEDGWVEVMKGISEGEQVVAEGAVYLDQRQER